MRAPYLSHSPDPVILGSPLRWPAPASPTSPGDRETAGVALSLLLDLARDPGRRPELPTTPPPPAEPPWGGGPVRALSRAGASVEGGAPLAALLDLALAAGAAGDRRRRVPSAGALYPVDAYLWDGCWWAYQPVSHRLTACPGGSAPGGRHPVLVLGLTPARTTWKYGHRALPSLLLDLGYAQASVTTAAAAVGLDCRWLEVPMPSLPVARGCVPMAAVRVGGLGPVPTTSTRPASGATRPGPALDTGAVRSHDPWGTGPALHRLRAGLTDVTPPAAPVRPGGDPQRADLLRRRRSHRGPMPGGLSAGAVADLLAEIGLTGRPADGFQTWVVASDPPAVGRLGGGGVLTAVARGDARATLVGWCSGQPNFATAGAMVCFVADLGPGFEQAAAYVQAGHAGYRLALAATQRDWAACPVAGWTAGADLVRACGGTPHAHGEANTEDRVRTRSLIIHAVALGRPHPKEPA